MKTFQSRFVLGLVVVAAALSGEIFSREAQAGGMGSIALSQSALASASSTSMVATAAMAGVSVNSTAVSSNLSCNPGYVYRLRRDGQMARTVGSCIKMSCVNQVNAGGTVICKPNYPASNAGGPILTGGGVMALQ